MRSGMIYKIETKKDIAVEILTRFRYIENDLKKFEKNSIIIEYFLEIRPEEKDSIIETFETREDGEMIVRELINRGLQRGIEQGIEQGIEKGVKLTAINLLKSGSDYEFVSKITGMSVEKIKKLERSDSGNN
jgi:predicted transposase/invertase (TIGR01784 family)